MELKIKIRYREQEYSCLEGASITSDDKGRIDIYLQLFHGRLKKRCAYFLVKNCRMEDNE